MTKAGWQTLITDTKSTDIESCATASGQRHLRWIGDKAYRWVKNVTGGALAVGAVVYFGTNDLSNAEVYSFGQAAKGTIVTTLGGVVTSTTIASNEYGWIQVFGYNAAVSTLGVVAVNEVQTVTVDAIMTAANIGLSAIKSDGSPVHVKVAYNTSWTQTVADIQTALIAQLGTAAVACAVTNTKDMTITFSGTGYAALPQAAVGVNIMSATGPTKVLVARTTPGVTASVVGDVLTGVSGQTYVTKTSLAGVAPVVAPHIIAMEAYATAVAANKKGFINCLGF